MAEKKVRKTDRRTLYTCRAIKDALLELLRTKDFGDITVADLCRVAEISRGTFYLHYTNIPEVLEELFDDALENTHSMLIQIDCADIAPDSGSVPLCRFLRENIRYQPLFFSDSLRPHIIRRITQLNRDGFVEEMRKKTGLAPEILQSIFDFQINGCLAVARSHIRSSDEEWDSIQCGIDRLLRSGIDGMMPGPGRRR